MWNCWWWFWLALKWFSIVHLLFILICRICLIKLVQLRQSTLQSLFFENKNCLIKNYFLIRLMNNNIKCIIWNLFEKIIFLTLRRTLFAFIFFYLIRHGIFLPVWPFFLNFKLISALKQTAAALYPLFIIFFLTFFYVTFHSESKN